jgi:hypothetical protein
VLTNLALGRLAAEVVIVTESLEPGLSTTIDQRVRLFLSSSETDDESVREYAGHLLAVCEGQAKEVQTQLRLALIVAAAFLVLARNEVDEVSLSGVKVNSFALLQSVLPLAVLALVLRSLLTIRDREINVHTYQKIVQHHRPGLFRSGLHDQLVPAVTPFARNVGAVVRGTAYGFFFHRVSRGERYVLLVGGPFAFAVYAYAVLFSAHSARNVAVWLSLVLAVGLAGLIARALFGPQVFGPSPWARPADPAPPETTDPATN